MKHRVASSACILSFSLLFGSLAFPCKVSHVRTAQEITRDSDAIILAEVTGYARKNEHGGDVTFRILEVLKGSVTAGQIILGGQTDTYDGPNDRLPPYDFVRQGGRQGNCYASDYKMERTGRAGPSPPESSSPP